MSDTDYSYEERILIDNYIDHVNNSRQHITFILNYLSATEQQFSRLLPENYRRISQRQPPLSNYTSSRNTLSNHRPRPLNIRRFDTQPSIPNTYPSTSSNANNYLSLLNIIRRLNEQQEASLSPVIIRPTRRQINIATEHEVFDSSNAYINTTCPITQQLFNNGDSIRRIRHCNHIFTDSSLLEWFERNTICPVCRYDIREYRNNETTQLQTTIADISNSTTQFIQDISSNFPHTSSYSYPPTSLPIPASTNNTSPNDLSNNLTNSITISSTSSTFLTDLISEDTRINPLLQIMEGLRNNNNAGENFEYSISGDILHVDSIIQ